MTRFKALMDRAVSEGRARTVWTPEDGWDAEAIDKIAPVRPRVLAIYPSLDDALTGGRAVNVSPGRWDSAADALDRMLPGEAAVLRDGGGKVIDIAEHATIAEMLADDDEAEFVWNLQHPPGSY